MPENSQSCPQCQSASAYQDGAVWVCAECFHEWTPQAAKEAPVEEAQKFVDANGVSLQSGDTVSLVKDLKLGKETLKSGTKVKNIRLLEDPVDGHDIACKIPGHGSMYLKCSVVKKSK